MEKHATKLTQSNLNLLQLKQAEMSDRIDSLELLFNQGLK